MWPYLFGPCWVLQLLIAIGVLGAAIALVKVALAATARRAVERPDEIQAIWRRYEAGDLTRWEFDRLRRAAGAAERTPPRKIAA